MNKSLPWLTLFAIAMAHVEAALVIHLRSVYYPGDPLAIFPLSILSTRDLQIELVREAATVVMILSVAALAARDKARIFAAFVFVFGMWDIFYYVWLKLMIGWPVSWLEWDVLFLIPWIWLGPWVAAALIALLFVLWGGHVVATQTKPELSFRSGLVFALGSLIALASFLLPALPLLSGGEAAFDGYQPGRFSWGIYTTGYLLMAIGLWVLPRHGRRSARAPGK